MNILDRLKEFFRSIGKKEQPRLPESTKRAPTVDIRDKYQVKQVPNLREPSFEECIDEFINQYNFQNEINPDGHDKAYKAFRRMFCGMEEDIGNNLKNQEKLGKLVRKYGYTESINPKKTPIRYMQISGERGVNEYKDLDMEKIYINCDRESIALLTTEIFEKIKDIAGDRLVMKYISEQFSEEDKQAEKRSTIKNYQRNEKIVIYLENHEMALKIAEIINGIRSRNPELFSSQKTLPFMPKKFGILGIASKKQSDFARTPIGNLGGGTYNDYIAEIVEKSIIMGFDKKHKLNSQENQRNLEERMSKYAIEYQGMEESKKATVISDIKQIFEQICRENNVNTFYTPQIQNDERQYGE